MGAWALILAGVVPVTTGTIDASSDAEAERKLTFRLRVEVGLDAMTIYNDRGSNVFTQAGPLEQSLSLAPSVRLQLGDTGFFVEYMSVYLVAGPDPETALEQGTSAEQNFSAGWEGGLGDRFTLGAGVTAIAHPFTSRGAVVRDGVPLAFEPTVVLTAHLPVDVGVQVVYAAGVQPELASSNFLYVQPHVSRSFGLGSDVALGTYFGAGYKFYDEPARNPGRRLDLDASVSLGFEVAGWQLAPALNAAWTDIPGRQFAESLMAWASFAVRRTL